jgi:hypothetical protein
MKKLLFLLVFIPIVSFGQVTELNDLLDITSLNQFKRICIENGYEKIKAEDETKIIEYMLSPTYEDEEIVSTRGIAYYYIDDGSWRIGFPENYGGGKIFYDRLFEEVKENCHFVDIVERKELEFAAYICSPNGAIGFTESEGWGIVHFFSNKNPKP